MGHVTPKQGSAAPIQRPAWSSIPSYHPWPRRRLQLANRRSSDPWNNKYLWRKFDDRVRARPASDLSRWARRSTSSLSRSAWIFTATLTTILAWLRSAKWKTGSLAPCGTAIKDAVGAVRSAHSKRDVKLVSWHPECKLPERRCHCAVASAYLSGCLSNVCLQPAQQK